MHYTLHTLPQLLLELQLIDTDALLFDDLEITSINRRNKNLEVSTKAGQHWLVKQPSHASSESVPTLRRESFFYHYCSQHLAEVADLIPTEAYSKPELPLLILTFYPEALPLWRYYNSRGIDQFPTLTSGAVGSALGRLHRFFLSKDLRQDARLDFIEDDLPFIFELHEPHPERLSYLKQGGCEYLRKLQSDQELVHAFRKAKALWNCQTLIHGDVKLDNFLALDPSKANCTDLKIVDWEMLQFGDTAWDVAGAFNDFVFWWVINMPDNVPPQEMLAQAKFPFQRLHPAVAAFWANYAEHLPPNVDEQLDFLARAITFSGLRTLQTAYEIACKFDRIPPIAQLLYNLGQSVLKNPEKARESFFSLSLQTSAA
ncbi:MAG: phosphotransferase [Salibacteraceae bacterium]